MESGKTLWIISGPTASGKTDRAIELALKIGAPVISADSRQIYRELNIGVAKPDRTQLDTVHHYFIDHVSIHEDYNAGRYASEARTLINDLFQTHDELLICGGTGLYINAVLKGLDSLPERNEALRKELENKLHAEGISALQEELKQLNPVKFKSMDIHNPQRLIRAIEIEKAPPPQQQNIPAFRFDFNIKNIVMDLPRSELYDRINRRVDLMMEKGLEAEAERFIGLQHLNALQTVGYSEWWPYFRGETSRDEVIEKIKQHTRNYAKRQLTWIRNKGTGNR